MLKRVCPNSSGDRALQPVKRSRLNEQQLVSPRLDASKQYLKPPLQHLQQVPHLPSTLASIRPDYELLASSVAQYLYRLGYSLPSGQFITKEDILILYNPVWSTFVDLHRSLWYIGIHLKPSVLAQHLWATFPGHHWPVAHDVPTLVEDSDAMAPPPPAQVHNVAIPSGLGPSHLAVPLSIKPVGLPLTAQMELSDMFSRTNPSHRNEGLSSSTTAYGAREDSRTMQHHESLNENLGAKYPHIANALRAFERKAVVRRRRETEPVQIFAAPNSPVSSLDPPAVDQNSSRSTSARSSGTKRRSDQRIAASKMAIPSLPSSAEKNAGSRSQTENFSSPSSSSTSSFSAKLQVSNNVPTATPNFEQYHKLPAVVDSETVLVSSGDAEPKLCPEQDALVRLIMAGSNVFYTGSAGCGKSTVLKAFVSRMKREGQTVHILAPTGKAALGVGGSTTWTYAGWTPDSMKKPMDELKVAAHANKIRKRMRSTNALVFDEVSMIENHHFERLNQVLQANRNNKKPFGGVQVIATGDFCQLPPVKPFQHCIHCGRTMTIVDGGLGYKCPQHGVFRDEDKWAFRSNAWKQCRFEHRNLTTIHRQSDKIFIDILNKYRYGVPLTEKDEHLLLKHDSITTHAVKLFPTRQEVAIVNNAEFVKLRSMARKFVCHDDFKWNPVHQTLRFKTQRDPHDNSLEALREHRYEASVELKQGMLVVLLQNLSLDEGLCNGSQGVIVGFKKHEESDIRKSTRALGEGIPYEDLKEANIRAFMAAAPQKVWPIVLFTNGIKRHIMADCSMNEMGDEKPYSLLSRTQIPVTAAWAMTVHKSQGMTLDRVIVDLANSFEEGQVYVALSRARSLEGLKVDCLGSYQGKANPQVMQFLTEKFGSCG